MASFIAGVSGAGASTSATNYAPIGYPSQVTSFGATEATVARPIPVTTNLTNLYVGLLTAPGVGKSFAFTVMKNGSTTGLTVTISGTNTTATDTINTAAFTAADTISLQAVPTSTPTASGKVWWNVQSDAVGQPIFGSSNNSTSTLQYTGVMGRGDATVETRQQVIMPCAGTISNLYVVLSVAPAGVTAKIITLRVNGVASTLTTTVTGAATSNSDTIHSVSVAAGDLVSMEANVTGAPAASATRTSILFTPTNANDSVILGANNDDPSNSATQYNLPTTCESSWTGTETDAQMIIGAYTIKNFYARTNAASGAATNFAFTVDNNTVATALTVTCSNTAAIQSIVTDVPIVQGDKLSLKSVPTNTPTVSRINTGILIRPTSSPPPATITYMTYRPPFLS